MTIKVSRFGEILTSRPEGREAALVLLSSDLRHILEPASIDFSGILVMTPSWLSEFTQTLMARGIKQLKFMPSTNSSVIESIKFIELEKTA
ncbi:MAG: hypothetical protein ABL927_03980 [Bdellovibrionales bacterium]